MSFLTELPSELNRLKKPPKGLFFKGNLELLNFPKIAIVGSRKCSSYTRNLVSSLSLTLAKYQICVVSGAAIGVDIAAHEAAFPHTIAVFGNGLDQIYPKSNQILIEKIYKNALALSEYNDETTFASWRFLERNRIVVGLCDALVVAQADFKSGSLQSARIALESGVPVYVLPQRVGDSDGTNDLLARNLANLITNFDDFALKFAKHMPKASKNDEVLEFVKYNPNLEECLAKFGDVIYEYELDGKVAINGLFVKIVG